MKLTEEQISKKWSEAMADTEGMTHLPIQEFARAIEAAVLAQVPVGINGLTEAETAETASVMGIVAPEAKQEPVAWLQPKCVDSFMRPDLGYETCAATDYGAFPVYTHPAPVNQALLESIAEVAHCGGLAGMSEADALILIRKLTIPHFRKERTHEQSRAAIAAAEGKV